MNARTKATLIRKYCQRQGIEAKVQGKMVGFDGIGRIFVDIQTMTILTQEHRDNLRALAKKEQIILTFKVPGHVDG